MSLKPAHHSQVCIWKVICLSPSSHCCLVSVPSLEGGGGDLAVSPYQLQQLISSRLFQHTLVQGHVSVIKQGSETLRFNKLLM